MGEDKGVNFKYLGEKVYLIKDKDLDNIISNFLVKYLHPEKKYYEISLQELLNFSSSSYLYNTLKGKSLVVNDVPIQLIRKFLKAPKTLYYIDHHPPHLKDEKRHLHEILKSKKGKILLEHKVSNLTLLLINLSSNYVPKIKDLLKNQEFIDIYNYVIKIEEESFDKFSEEDERLYFLLPYIFNDSTYLYNKFFSSIDGLKELYKFLREPGIKTLKENIKKETYNLIKENKLRKYNNSSIDIIRTSNSCLNKNIPFFYRNKDVLYFYYLSLTKVRYFFRTYNPKVFEYLLNNGGGGRRTITSNKFIGGGVFNLNEEKDLENFLLKLSYISKGKEL